MEATSLLDKALWKARIAEEEEARGGDGDCLDGRSRERCRITSGAGMVVLNVLAFLGKNDGGADDDETTYSETSSSYF